jgi:DNA-binding transcriptional ArsR family regulator
VEKVFKALADTTRRKLLDRLRKENGQSLSELCSHLSMSRQAVSKHLLILENADLIIPRWNGRKKMHYLNPLPIFNIFERWISKYEYSKLEALSALKKDLEAKQDN